jgi:hypothetical protein
VAGLDESGKPFLSGMDLIGATVAADDFCVSGKLVAGQRPKREEGADALHELSADNVSNDFPPF